MMRGIALGVCMLNLAGWMSHAGAASRHAFEWMRAIEGELVAGQIFRVEVPPDVYARSFKYPNDLRVYDADNRQWPFYVERPSTAQTFLALGTETLNHSLVETPETYWRLDFFIPRSAINQSRLRHNQIHVTASGSDYVRRVEIYGSENQTDWAVLGKGYILNVNQPRRMVENIIHYPVSDYPYIQVRVYPNARNALESFTVQQVALRMQQEVIQPMRKVERQVVELSRTEQVPDAQVVMYDLQFKNQPVEQVRLRSEDGDYFRRVVVYHRNEDREPWRYSGAGDIHRVGMSVKDRISVHSSGRFLKCEIYHYDDAPLNLEEPEFSTIRPYLVVEAKSSGPAALFYGYPFAEPPRYDLAVRTAQMTDTEWGVRSLGAPMANPLFKKTGYGKWGPWLATIIIGICGMAIIIVIVRMFKENLPPDESSGT